MIWEDVAMPDSFLQYKFNRVIAIFILFSFLIISNGCKDDNQTESAQQPNINITASTSTSTSDQTKDIEPSEKTKLSILYAGQLGKKRAKDFTDFLSKYFTEIKTTDYKTFKGTEYPECDVVIIDYDGKDFDTPTPNLSPSYKRATITMGVPGAFICSRQNLKTGYL